MHELGILSEVVQTVENFARMKRLTKIDTVVLQVGELSPIVPRYLEMCYPAVVDGTLLQDTKLKIEILPGNGRCQNCSNNYNLVENDRRCPSCGSYAYETLSGKEFLIKELIAY